MFQKNWILLFLFIFMCILGFVFGVLEGGMAAVLCWWKWERGGIFKGVLGVFFFFCSVFFFASCMVVEIFKLSDDRDEGKIGVMKTKEGAIGMW